VGEGGVRYPKGAELKRRGIIDPRGTQTEGKGQAREGM